MVGVIERPRAGRRWGAPAAIRVTACGEGWRIGAASERASPIAPVGIVVVVAAAASIVRVVVRDSEDATDAVRSPSAEAEGVAEGDAACVRLAEWDTSTDGEALLVRVGGPKDTEAVPERPERVRWCVRTPSDTVNEVLRVLEGPDRVCWCVNNPSEVESEAL